MLADIVIDSGLSVISDSTVDVLFTTNVPSNRDEALTSALASVTLQFSEPADYVGGGRAIVSPDMTPVVPSGTGTAHYWVAINDTTLLGYAPMASPTALVTGVQQKLAPLTIWLPAA